MTIIIWKKPSWVNRRSLLYLENIAGVLMLTMVLMFILRSILMLMFMLWSILMLMFLLRSILMLTMMFPSIRYTDKGGTLDEEEGEVCRKT